MGELHRQHNSVHYINTDGPLGAHKQCGCPSGLINNAGKNKGIDLSLSSPSLLLQVCFGGKELTKHFWWPIWTEASSRLSEEEKGDNRFLSATTTTCTAVCRGCPAA